VRLFISAAIDKSLLGVLVRSLKGIKGGINDF
jgi:hypothetical protein